MSTQASDWQVPAATLRWLDAVPAERGVAMLVRHSVRDPLPPGDLGYANTLNAEGVALARSLGERLHGRVRSLHTSPLQRCVHTAEVFARVAGDTPPILTDRMLGDPGAWVLDRVQAGNLYVNRGITGALVARQPFGGFKLSGVGAKAGGPDYLLQFLEPRTLTENTQRRGFAPEI